MEPDAGVWVGPGAGRRSRGYCRGLREDRARRAFRALGQRYSPRWALCFARAAEGGCSRRRTRCPRAGHCAPFFPAVGEMPVTIDKTLEQMETKDDEYIYWPGGRMTSLFPASTNGDYHGNPIAAIVLTLLAVLTIAPGCIHAFLPDGGAGVIAGLDLSQNGTTIIGVFAWVGATQIVWGALMLLVSLTYRSFVPLFLALILIERTIIALNQWIFKPGEAAHHPPEAYATLAAIPIVLLMLALSLRRRETREVGDAAV